MISLHEIIKPNKVILQVLNALSISPALKETIRKLKQAGNNPLEITSIKTQDGIFIKLKVKDGDLPAVINEAYNGGNGITCHFDNIPQAELMLNDSNQVNLLNLSQDTIYGGTLVRLVSNDNNLGVVPVVINSHHDYAGVIGKAAGVIDSFQFGPINLLQPSQFIDLQTFKRLTIRGIN